MNNNIKFWFPATFEKAEGEEGKKKLRFKGVASTKIRDTDGEILIPEGFDLSFFKDSGFVNWHHQTRNSPLAVIGEPVKAEIRKGELYVEVELYESNPIAQETFQLGQVLENDSKTRRLGFSIEGKAVERDKKDNKTITKAKITGLAITHMPKNPATLAEIIKGEEDGSNMQFGENDLLISFEKEKVEKSEDSSGMDTESGKPLIKEDLDRSKEREKNKKKKKKLSELEDEDFDKDDEELKEDSDEEDEEKVKKIKKIKKSELKFFTKGEVVNKIFKDFKNIETNKASKIYNLIEKISQQMNEDKITNEAIEKAYEILGIEKGEDEINKSEEFVEIMKGMSNIMETINLKNESNDELLKGIVEKQEEILETYREIQSRIDNIEKQPAGVRRSVSNVKQIERFEKAADDNKTVLSANSNKKQIINILEELTFEKGQINDVFGQALSMYDSSRFISPQIRNIIESRKNIKIVD